MHASEVDLSQLNGHACRRLSCCQLLNLFFSYSTITVPVANGNLAVSSVRPDTDLAHFQIVTYFMTNANLPPTVAKWVIAFNICPPPPPPTPWLRTYLFFIPLRPVVWRPIIANPGLNFNPGFSFFCSKAFSWLIFSILFRASYHQTIDENYQNEFAF